MVRDGDGGDNDKKLPLQRAYSVTNTALNILCNLAHLFLT